VAPPRSGSAKHCRIGSPNWPTSPRDYQPIEVFVGPPGAGKTTTIAKIAAQARARRGARFSLIAADGFRVGAIDQLRTYADILDAPFYAAPSATDLETLLTAASDKPTLVDTAGRSPSDRESRELFAALERMPSVADASRAPCQHAGNRGAPHHRELLGRPPVAAGVDEAR
jgi:flagellar biosynthesis GTPase FlhF